MHGQSVESVNAHLGRAERGRAACRASHVLQHTLIRCSACRIGAHTLVVAMDITNGTGLRFHRFSNGDLLKSPAKGAKTVLSATALAATAHIARFLPLSLMVARPAYGRRSQQGTRSDHSAVPPSSHFDSTPVSKCSLWRWCWDAMAIHVRLGGAK